MAIGDLTLKTDGSERISKNVGILIGEIDVGGTTATAGTSVTTSSATGKHNSGKKISEFFDTLLHVTCNASFNEAPGGGDVGIAELHTTFYYDKDEDLLHIYVDTTTSGIMNISNADTCVGVITVTAYGLMNTSPSV